MNPRGRRCYRKWLALLAFACTLLSVPAAMACGSGKVLYSDNFKKIDPSWNLPFAKQENDGVRIELAPNLEVMRLNQSGLYNGNYEICLTAALLYDRNDAGSLPSIDIVFFGLDKDNFYEAEFAPRTGRYEFLRLQSGRWLTPDRGRMEREQRHRRPRISN